MQTLKTLRAFVAYPDGFTRTEYVADQVITLTDDAAKSYMDAGHCIPHNEKAAAKAPLNPKEFKTLGELKDAVGANTLKEVEALVEALGHEVPDKRAVAPIPIAIYDTIVNKHHTAIADAKAAEEKAAADAKLQAESDAKALEAQKLADEKQKADEAALEAEKKKDDEANAPKAAEKTEVDAHAAHPAKADGTHKAKD